MSKTEDPTERSCDDSSPRADLGAPCWIEIPSKDVRRAKAFYETVFKWNFPPVREGYPDDAFAMFTHHKPSLIGAIRKVGDTGPQPGAVGGPTVFLLVDNVDEMLEKIKEAGGTVVQGKTAIEGHTVFAKYKDIDGNVGGILKWLI